MNLVDYYLIRHGQYDVPAFFKVSGRYGGFAGPACICYVIGAAVADPVHQPGALHRSAREVPWRCRHLVAGRLRRGIAAIPGWSEAL